MSVVKIVITGGPCAGKTTGLSWIRNAFTKQGWTVLIVPETATELITGGVAPWTCGTNLDYQKVQMRLQMEKERLFEQAARTMRAEKILIVCNDDGWNLGLEVNRLVLSKEGNIEQAIRGDFFVCGAGEEDFISLTDLQIKKLIRYSFGNKYPGWIQ